jgi:replicative DNA helicase
LPPQNLEAEQSVLGAVMIDETALVRVMDTRLRPDEFYKEAHGLIYAAILELDENSQPVDLVTLGEVLRKNGTLEKVGGAAYLAQLTDAVGTAANVEFYARIVREKAVLRRLIAVSGRIVEECQADAGEVDQVVDNAERAIFALQETRVEQSLQRVDTELLTRTINMVEERMSSDGSIIGVPTGFKDLDLLTSGLQPSDLIIIAGRPSMGKTALALNIAVNAAIVQERDVKRGEPVSVALFSLEMSLSQIVLRLLCAVAEIDLHAVRTGRLRDTDFHLLTHAADILSRAPMFIDESGYVNVMDIRARARRLKSRLLSEGGDLGLIIVDYLQLVRGREAYGRGQSDSREREISEISRSLKALAKELHVPVVALSQLNRQVETRPGDKRPILADLRESGAIEQDADVVAFVFREEFYNSDNEELRGKAELLVRKQRNGPQGTVHLTFKHASARFLSASQREESY